MRGSRFLQADDRAALGIQDGGNIVPAVPFAFGGTTAYAPEAEEGPLAIDEANEPPAPTATAVATATGQGSSPAAGQAASPAVGQATPPAAASRLDLPVVEPARNGHANGNGNGNGNGHANGRGTAASAVAASLGSERAAFKIQEDAPSCMDCGSIMVRNGSCYKCLNCGSTSGCS